MPAHLKSIHHCPTCGKLKLTRTGKAHICTPPKAVVTLTVEGDRLNVKLVFSPAAKTTGPVHPAHSAAIEMLGWFNAKKQKGV
jgi:hypothetical protein